MYTYVERTSLIIIFVFIDYFIFYVFMSLKLLFCYKLIKFIAFIPNMFHIFYCIYLKKNIISLLRTCSKSRIRHWIKLITEYEYFGFHVQVLGRGPWLLKTWQFLFCKFSVKWFHLLYSTMWTWNPTLIRVFGVAKPVKSSNRIVQTLSPKAQ